jgi:hypothetical protein
MPNLIKTTLNPICVALPKVAKASTEGDIAGVIALNFANVNTA